MVALLRDLLATPADLDDGERARAWFATISQRLLNGALLVAGDTLLRPVEIELYYHGGAHLDPFVHQDPLQKSCGQWYFHRAGEGYRGGSFKGLDVTFGREDHYGGVLIRSLAREDGRLIDGPCLCVNHLLDLTGHGHVRELDAAIAERPVWDTSSPLHLRPDDALDPRDVLYTARVGLTLKRDGDNPARQHYISQPYRALTDPRGVKKGKRQINLALHARGLDVEAIRAASGSPRATILKQLGPS